MVVVDKYDVDKAIPQMAQKLSFFVKITQFLVCEPFFFFTEQRKRVNEDLSLFACFSSLL